MRKLLKAMRSEKGFTLIELLVVIGILAALAGVVTLGVTQFIGRGANEANCIDLHNVQTAAAACLVERASGVPELTCTGPDGLVGLVKGGFLLTMPRCEYNIAANGVVTQTKCPGGSKLCAP